MNNLGLLYLAGEGVKQDYAKARDLFERATAASSPYAPCNLGEMYLAGQGVAKDEKRAVALFTKSADLGNMVCQVHMGERLAEGIGIEIDLKQAYLYLDRAAQQGSTHAKVVSAMILMSPDYAERDAERGRRLLEDLANAGDAESEFRLGFAYEVGRLGRRDAVSARKWYERAAAHGISDAQGELGMFYAYGMGVNRDFDAAANWLEKATAGTEDYNVELARLYMHRGDFKRAADLLGKNVDGMSSLGKHVYGRLCLEQMVCSMNRAQAQALFDAPLLLEPNKKNNVAWFLAVFPTADSADGVYAARLIEPYTAKRDASWKWVGTLAAAYARSGDIPRAITTQKRANEMQRAANKQSASSDGAPEAMLQTYQTGKPWELPY
ncbi:tetratricopeptide repeat protein [Dokdonella soli]